LVVGQVQVQHVELVELQQVDYPPDLPDRDGRAGQVERQTAPGESRRVEDAQARHGDLAGPGRCGQQLDQRAQAARDADRFHGAQHDLISVDHQRVSLVGGTVGGR
jgi:hypothetical protein